MIIFIADLSVMYILDSTSKLLSLENSKKFPSQFPRTQVDVFRLLVLCDQCSKTKHIKFTIILKTEKKKMLTFERLQSVSVICLMNC